jgi:hypothetical protein
MTLKPIDSSIQGFISSKNIYVLRDAKTGTALNTSYTPEGLYWTSNASGKLICFRNAKLVRTYNAKYELTSVKIAGDTRFSNKVYIEKFIPTDKPTKRGQIAEYTWTNKAVWLCAQSPR